MVAVAVPVGVAVVVGVVVAVGVVVPVGVAVVVVVGVAMTRQAREVHRFYLRRWRAAKRLRGECDDCPARAEPGRRRCQKHLDAKNELSQWLWRVKGKLLKAERRARRAA